MSAKRYYLGEELRERERQRERTRFNTDKSCQNDDNDDDGDESLYPCDGNNNNDNTTTKSNNGNEPEPDADKDDYSEFLQDVPYSSSSIDRSSIGSIPWADDAIKKNKLDWERVDRMLSGEETLSEQEVELRLEISDWQRKFPSLLARKAKPLKQHSFDNGCINTALLPDDVGDIDSISDLSLNSLDDYGERDQDQGGDEDDGFVTPTVERQKAMPSTASSVTTRNRSRSRNYSRPTQNLVTMLDRDLRITSVALNLRKRREYFEHQSHMQTATMPQSATVLRSRCRLRMPPILNVLDSNRRFRGVLNNRSFVQLTQVQVQPKSAALTYATSAERWQQTGVRTAWNMPMAASRFLNNKHSIVLPSLNRQKYFTPTASTSSQSIASRNNSSSLGSSLDGAGHNVQNLDQHSLTNANTASTGRSISAAIHHPRSEFAPSSAFFIPYSASKFKTFK